MKDVVLVTGGTGFLGGALIKALVESGSYDVKALVRRLDGVDLPSNVELVPGDVLDLDSLVRALDGCVGLFHVAAYVKSWAPDSARFYEVNVGGLNNVIEAVKRSPSVKKVVYTSSFFALGPTENGRLGDEQQVHPGRSFCTEYEKSKYEADKVATSAAVPIVALYPGVIYGPGKLTRGNIIAEILIERFSGRLPGYIGNGKDRFSFAHVDDVAAGHIAAFERGIPGQRYILGGENASLVDVFDIAADLTKTSKPKVRIPMFLVWLYGYLSVMVGRIIGFEPVVSHPALKAGLADVLKSLKDKRLIAY